MFAARDIDKQIGQRIEKVRTTAYTHGAAENGAYPSSNAIGTRLKSGALSSAAADWSHWPVGTRFRVVETGHEYIIDDIGGAIVGTNTIDLFKPNSRAVRLWGARDRHHRDPGMGVAPRKSRDSDAISVVKIARLARWLPACWFRMPRNSQCREILQRRILLDPEVL